MIFSSFKWKDGKILELEQAANAYVYYRHRRMNLLTGFPESYPITEFFKELERVQLQDRFSKPRVYHLHYELGLILMGLGHTVSDETPLAVMIDYQKHSLKKLLKPRLPNLPLKCLERPSWTEYKTAFAHIQEKLLDGHCYQVNLTYPFDFETEDVLDPRDIKDFFFSRKGTGAYAHASFWGEEMILSNSPECLFHYEKNSLFSMPIKGTVSRRGDWRLQWKELSRDEKQEGELFMIVDLLRHDLNRLAKPQTKILKLKAPLLVPGLLHQYALLKVKLEENVSLYRTISCLFPGGSITGAPKKRVMEIIQGIERFQRGAYCGSTLLCLDSKKIASINIRTAQIAPMERIWRYGAGGGITLLSKAPSEFHEMESKINNFLTLIKAPGY